MFEVLIYEEMQTPTTKPKIPYTTPTIYKGSDKSPAWCIDFFHWHEGEGKMKRVRITKDGNRKSVSPTLRDKREFFEDLLAETKQLLKEGWSPFDKVSNAELKKSLIAPTLDEALALYKSGKIGRGNSLKKHNNNIKLFIGALGGSTKVTSIDTFDIVNAMTKLEAESKNGKWLSNTFNAYKFSLGNLYSFLKENKYVTYNPTLDIKTRRKETTLSHEEFSKEDRKAIYNWLDKHAPQTAMFARMIFYTSIRPNELRQLQLKHVDLKNDVITIPSHISKNGDEGHVRINEQVKTMLLTLDLNKHEQDEYLFTSEYGKRVGYKMMHSLTMYMSFKKCLESLELTGKGYTLYGMKHAGNVQKLNSGWDIVDVTAGNRHKSPTQLNTYIKAKLRIPKVSKPMLSIEDE